ncbi:MAG: NAD(P)H-dependent glycerol-3-phosphate dehydrogenase [Mycoplasma sp.]
MSKILVVGTGAWGTTLANVLLENNHTVNMYGVDSRQLQDLSQGYNREFFRNAKLSAIPNIVTDNFEIAVKDVEYILLSIPSKFIEQTLQKYKDLIDPKIIIINSSKGIDQNNGKNYFEVIRSVLPNNQVCSIVGPSFAIEVFHNQNTIVNIVCKDVTIANQVGKLFNNDYFKTSSLSDEIGSSLFSALKNGLAVCCGVLYGFNSSINTIAAVISLGMKEITKYVEMQGGDVKTAVDFCAIGDIYLTCSDNKSRNFRFGELISKLGVNKAIDENTYTVEGLEIIKNIHNAIQDKKEFVLFNLLFDLVSCKIQPNEFVNLLWNLFA